MARVPRPFVCFTALVIALCGASCIPRGGHINKGPGSLESIRQKLAGDWELVSLTTEVEPGKAVSWDVGGHLQYDRYGMLTVQLARRADDPLASDQILFLDFTAEAVIDVQRRLLRVEHITNRSESTGRVPAALAPDQPRRFEFDGALLKTYALDDRGRTTATFVWRRAP
jgi:hypothetical protein